MADDSPTTPHFMLSGLKDAAGLPLAAGLVYTYKAGTTEQKAIYTNAAMDSTADFPVVLDDAGVAVLYGIGNYKFVICDSIGAIVQTLDGVHLGYDSGLSFTDAAIVPFLLSGIPDANGNLLTKGSVTTYVAGTDTLAEMNPGPAINPMVLAVEGIVSVQKARGAYKFVIKDEDDAVIRTIDDIYIGAAPGGGGGE